MAVAVRNPFSRNRVAWTEGAPWWFVHDGMRHGECEEAMAVNGSFVLTVRGGKGVGKSSMLNRLLAGLGQRYSVMRLGSWPLPARDIADIVFDLGGRVVGNWQENVQTLLQDATVRPTLWHVNVHGSPEQRQVTELQQLIMQYQNQSLAMEIHGEEPLDSYDHGRSWTAEADINSQGRATVRFATIRLLPLREEGVRRLLWQPNGGVNCAQRPCGDWQTQCECHEPQDAPARMGFRQPRFDLDQDAISEVQRQAGSHPLILHCLCFYLDRDWPDPYPEGRSRTDTVQEIVRRNRAELESITRELYRALSPQCKRALALLRARNALPWDLASTIECSGLVYKVGNLLHPIHLLHSVLVERRKVVLPQWLEGAWQKDWRLAFGLVAGTATLVVAIVYAAMAAIVEIPWVREHLGIGVFAFVFLLVEELLRHLVFAELSARVKEGARYVWQQICRLVRWLIRWLRRR